MQKNIRVLGRERERLVTSIFFLLLSPNPCLSFTWRVLFSQLPYHLVVEYLFCLIYYLFMLLLFYLNKILGESQLL